MQMPTGREPISKFKRKCLPASLWRACPRREPAPHGNLRTSVESAQPAAETRGRSPWGSAFLNALPASTKQVAASCLLWSCKCSWAAWQKAFPAAGTEKSELSLSGAPLVRSHPDAGPGGGSPLPRMQRGLERGRDWPGSGGDGGGGGGADVKASPCPPEAS